MADEITATVDDEGNTIVTIPPQIMVPLVAGRSLTGGDHGQ